LFVPVRPSGAVVLVRIRVAILRVPFTRMLSSGSVLECPQRSVSQPDLTRYESIRCTAPTALCFLAALLASDESRRTAGVEGHRIFWQVWED
jgi:hypothetical protein